MSKCTSCGGTSFSNNPTGICDACAQMDANPTRIKICDECLDKKLYTEDGEVTPTMKVKRMSIYAQYEDLIESMYKE